MEQDISEVAIKSALPLGDWFIPATYATIIVLTYVFGLLLGWMTREELMVHPFISTPIIFPVLLVLSPPVLSPINLIIGGDIVSSIVIGLIPGVAFFFLTILSTLFGISNGDSSAILLSVSYMGIGLIGALIGITLFFTGKQFF